MDPRTLLCGAVTLASFQLVRADHDDDDDESKDELHLGKRYFLGVASGIVLTLIIVLIVSCVRRVCHEPVQCNSVQRMQKKRGLKQCTHECAQCDLERPLVNAPPQVIPAYSIQSVQTPAYPPPAYYFPQPAPQPNY